jgi:peptidoglycan lytic transglycosylase
MTAKMEVDLRNLVMGCAVAALVALSVRSEARPPELKVLQSPSSVAASSQFGVASWYGPECQGLPTASGKPFDMEGMTCAHRQLPLGTTIRVTNLLNSRSLILKVTDRGPAPRDRVLDVSMGAAKRLGFLRAGLTPVRIQVLTYPQGTLISQANTKALASQAN